jgi:hypothetical protein
VFFAQATYDTSALEIVSAVRSVVISLAFFRSC